MGGRWSWGWGAQSDEDSIAALHRAMDAGLNWIDTAPVYGLGHSETVVGRFLKERDEAPLVFTKCGLPWNQAREVVATLTPESVRQEVEASLRRLGVEVIDLLQIHWPNPEKDIERAWETMAALQSEGKVRHLGVSNFSVAQMKRVQKIAPITSLQPPYSLVARNIESDVLPYCAQHDIGVLVYSPMASGLLSGKMTRERIAAFEEDDWRRRSDQFKEPNLTKNLELVERLKTVGERHQASAAEAAIAWTLKHPAVTAAIVGVRRPDQVDGIVMAPQIAVREQDWSTVE